MNDDRLKTLLRSAFPESEALSPSRDLWPSIVARAQTPAGWTWIDIGVAAGVGIGVTITLVMLPKALLLLAYHL